MPDSPRFREISAWLETPDDLRPPLGARLQADVVVIGAGYTGLSAALSLRRQGASVAVLERHFAGSGASGRNAGHLTPTIGKDMPSLLRFFGRERAGALARFADAAVGYTEDLIRKCVIECEYEPNGNVLAGLHPGHAGRLQRAAAAARSLGAGVRYLPEPEMRARGLPPAFHCGVFEERGGILNPGRYALGLRRAALEAGVQLFETSPLVALDPGRRVEARTDGGSVTADFAVLATNAFTPQTGFQRRRVVPVRVSLFETGAIDEAHADVLGWPGREGIYTAHEALESYRPTQRGTVVGGSRFVRYAYGSRLAPTDDPAVFAALERAFRERLPALADVPVAHFWSGFTAFTTDFLPVLGADGPRANVLYGIGYAGHGVAQATLMGDMLAERVSGREHEWESALRRRGLAWPPEPLRWLIAKLVDETLAALDRRTDRRLRRGAAAGTPGGSA